MALWRLNPKIFELILNFSAKSCGHWHSVALVQTSIRNRLITKPFEFFLEMQQAALDISDHWIIG